MRTRLSARSEVKVTTPRIRFYTDSGDVQYQNLRIVTVADITPPIPGAPGNPGPNGTSSGDMVAQAENGLIFGTSSMAIQNWTYNGTTYVNATPSIPTPSYQGQEIPRTFNQVGQAMTPGIFAEVQIPSFSFEFTGTGTSIIYSPAGSGFFPIPLASTTFSIEARYGLAVTPIMVDVVFGVDGSIIINSAVPLVDRFIWHLARTLHYTTRSV